MHSLLAYLLTSPPPPPPHQRTCKSNGLICNGEPHIIFAWALNASGLHLPPSVGVQIGPSSGINSIVVQIHYGYPQCELAVTVSPYSLSIYIIITSL